MSGMKTWIPVRLLRKANVRTLCHSSLRDDAMHCFIFSASKLRRDVRKSWCFSRIFHFRVVKMMMLITCCTSRWRYERKSTWGRILSQAENIDLLKYYSCWATSCVRQNGKDMRFFPPDHMISSLRTAAHFFRGNLQKYEVGHEMEKAALVIGQDSWSALTYILSFQQFLYYTFSFSIKRMQTLPIKSAVDVFWRSHISSSYALH